MDDDFRILFDYVEQMKRELQDEADLQTKSAEDEEKKCVHESIETEEAYVCCKCGLAVPMEFADVFVNVDGAHLGHDCCVFVTSKILLQVYWPTRELVSFTPVRLNEKHGPMILRLRFRKQITTFDEGLGTIDIKIQRVEVHTRFVHERPAGDFQLHLVVFRLHQTRTKKKNNSLTDLFFRANQSRIYR